MSDRIFTEEEVREIVRRASRQQAEDAERREAREHGLTLEDLERLGAEVGLDPVYLRAAADAVQTGRRPVVETETQTDTHVIVERRIEHPFTPEAWEDTVEMLRQSFGLDMGTWYGNNAGGSVERVGRAHEWSHMSQWGTETRVSVSEREGYTRLLLSQRVGHASPKVEGVGYGALSGLVAWLLAGSLLGGSDLFLFLLVSAVFLTALVATPRLEQKRRDKKQDLLKKLAADIERTFAEAAPARKEVGQQDRDVESVAPRLDLDALPDEEEEARASSLRRTRS